MPLEAESLCLWDSGKYSVRRENALGMGVYGTWEGGGSLCSQEEKMTQS